MLPQLSPEALNAALMLPLMLLVCAWIATLILVRNARAKIGPVIALQRPGKARRLAVFAGVPLTVLAIVLITRDLPLASAVLCLSISAWIGVLSPGFQDALCGERGVQRGFHARRFEELEEWRLTGEHLRFRLYGEWTSVPLPYAKQEQVRAALLRLAPERENQFKD